MQFILLIQSDLNNVHICKHILSEFIVLRYSLMKNYVRNDKTYESLQQNIGNIVVHKHKHTAYSLSCCYANVTYSEMCKCKCVAQI